MLQKTLLRHLGPAFGAGTTKPVQYYALKPVAESCALLLATLAYIGSKDETAVRQAFEAGWKVLGLPLADLPATTQCKLTNLDAALDTLDTVSLREKRKLLNACLACLVFDHEVTAAEAELFRATADALGVPVPPILPGVRLG